MKRLLRGATVLVVLAAVLGASVTPAMGAAASTSASKAKQAQIKSKIATLKDQVDEASAEEADMLGRLDDVKAKRNALQGNLDKLNGQIDDVQVGLNAAESQLEAATAQVVDAEEKLLAAKAEVRKAHDELRARAVQAYVRVPQANVAQVSLKIRSQRAMAAERGYLHAVVNAQADAVDHFREVSLRAAELQKAVEAQRDDARNQRDLVATQKAELVASQQSQETLVRQVQNEADNEARLLGDIRNRKAEFSAQIAALQRESDSIANLLRGLQSGQGNTVSGHGVLSSPIPGAPITSSFGYRVHPIFGDLRLHTGIDFGAAYGTPIRAAADGVVVSAGPLGGYGNATIIDHGGSLATLTAHQSKINVAPGSHVSRGQVIGLVGCSGFCTGPHLHFEVRVNGTPVDPLPYL